MKHEDRDEQLDELIVETIEGASDELVRRFTYHPPVDGAVDKFKRIRGLALVLAAEIERLVPNGREKANATTAVEEAVMWANAGIARPVAAAPRDLSMRRG
ncbi:MAG: hypothetical protein KC501_37675 [Myxococcales bacterium]|nr:hypothetical protein [Myxococcales bacterium]